MVKKVKIALPELRLDKRTMEGLKDAIGPLPVEGDKVPVNEMFPANAFTLISLTVVEFDEPARTLRACSVVDTLKSDT